MTRRPCHDRKRIDRILQAPRIAAILKVVSRFQLDMLVKGFWIVRTTSWISASRTFTDHDTAFRGIPVNL